MDVSVNVIFDYYFVFGTFLTRGISYEGSVTC